MRDFDHLVDRNEIAHLLGVGPTAVSNYVAQSNKGHPPFPEAVIVRANGRFRLWDIVDVAKWHHVAFPKRIAVWQAWDRRLRKYRKGQS